jgi:hypothetical protein
VAREIETVRERLRRLRAARNEGQIEDGELHGARRPLPTYVGMGIATQR